MRRAAAGGGGGGSRFCRCPICGVHVALLMAQEHAAACAEGTLVRGGAQAPPASAPADEAPPASAPADEAPTASAHASQGRASPPAQQPCPQPRAWGSLKAPSAKDIRGPRRTRKALDRPPQPFDFLLILDYEWTCDNRRRLEPSEIIEFPSVLVKCDFPPHVVDEFQVYCKPQVNPTLSKFCTELTGICQATVDGGVLLAEALEQHTAWLRRHGLLESADEAAAGARPTGTFAIVTWSDADVAGQLNSELSRLGVPRPAHFDTWINLKLLYKQHYKREPTGGLVSVLLRPAAAHVRPGVGSGTHPQTAWRARCGRVLKACCVVRRAGGVRQGVRPAVCRTCAQRAGGLAQHGGNLLSDDAAGLPFHQVDARFCPRRQCVGAEEEAKAGGRSACVERQQGRRRCVMAWSPGLHAPLPAS